MKGRRGRVKSMNMDIKDPWTGTKGSGEDRMQEGGWGGQGRVMGEKWGQV